MSIMSVKCVGTSTFRWRQYGGDLDSYDVQVRNFQPMPITLRSATEQPHFDCNLGVVLHHENAIVRSSPLRCQKSRCEGELELTRKACDAAPFAAGTPSA